MKKTIKTITICYKKPNDNKNTNKTNQINQKQKFNRKQNESNKEIKQYEIKQERENIKDDDNDLGRSFELTTSNKIHVNGLNLHEMKNESLVECKGDFELIGSMLTGE